VRQLYGSPQNGPDAGFDAVMAELAVADSPKSCISSEDFSLLYDRPDLLYRLRDAIRSAGFVPTVIVYVRAQVSYSGAIYAANVLSGYRLPFTTFLSDVISRGCYVWDGGFGPPFDYDVLLDAFAEIFGRDAIIVKPFRSDAPDTALLRSFMSILLPQFADLAYFSVPAKRANRTLTFAAVLRLLGAQNDFDEHLRFSPFRLRDVLRCWFRFAPSNRRLAARYVVRIPVFDFLDLVRALPIRRTLSMTRQLWQARRTLRKVTRAT